jgi:hypothetical protein
MCVYILRKNIITLRYPRRRKLIFLRLLQIQFNLLAMPRLRRRVAGLSRRGPGFDPGSIHVRFLVDKVVLGPGFSPCTSVSHSTYHSANAPHFFYLHTTLLRRTSRRSLRAFKQSDALSGIGVAIFKKSNKNASLLQTAKTYCSLSRRITNKLTHIISPTYSSNVNRALKSRMNWAGHVARMRDRRVHTGFWCGNLMAKYHLGDLGVNGRKLLKWIFNKWDGGLGLD